MEWSRLGDDVREKICRVARLVNKNEEPSNQEQEQEQQAGAGIIGQLSFDISQLSFAKYFGFVRVVSWIVRLCH